MVISVAQIASPFCGYQNSRDLSSEITLTLLTDSSVPFTGQKIMRLYTHVKQATKYAQITACLARLLQNELNSDVAGFTTHIKPVLQQIRLLTGLNVGGKTRNITIQLVLQQCCKTSCTFFVARFSVPLRM